MSVIDVQNGNNDGTGSLRYIIENQANPGDIVEIPPTVSEIVLSGSPIYISKTLTIRSATGHRAIITKDQNTTNPYFVAIPAQTDTVTFSNINFEPHVNDSNNSPLSFRSGIGNVIECNFLGYGNSLTQVIHIVAFLDAYKLNVERCNFQGMTGTNISGAIDIIKDGSGINLEVAITDCTFGNVQGRPNYGFTIQSENNCKVKATVTRFSFASDSNTDSLAVGMRTFTGGQIDMTLNDCTFERINSIQNQRGIEVGGDDGTTVLTVNKCTFTNMHTTGNGSCILFLNDTPVTANITSSVFTGNTSGNRGGAIGVDNNFDSSISGYINDCTFSNNECLTYTNPNDNGGGAIFIYTRSSFVIDNCLFDSNTARQYGGAAFIVSQDTGNFIVRNSTFIRNDTQGRGALNCHNGGIMTVENCIVRENTTTMNSSSDGGTTGIYVGAGALSTTNITSCAIVNNSGGYSPFSVSFVIRDKDPNLARTCILENSTIAENTTTAFYASAINLVAYANGDLFLNNNTIANNVSTVIGLPGIYSTNKTTSNDAQYTLNNNLIFNNVDPNGENNFGGNLSYYDVNNSYCNLITQIGGTFQNGVRGNIIGTTSNPIPISSLGVGTLGYYGGTYVIPLLEGSMAINKGSNSYGYDGSYDQRGSPYRRIYNSIIDIGAYEYNGSNPVPCFDGESLVVTRNIKTSVVAKVPAKNVYAGVHEVYDVKNKKFIPVIHNAVSEGATRLVLFKKDVFGPNKPNKDFKITYGHMMYVGGYPRKASQVKHGVKIKVPSQKVYSIVTKTWTPIKINNLDVYAWSEKKWKQNCSKRGFLWDENKP